MCLHDYILKKCRNQHDSSFSCPNCRAETKPRGATSVTHDHALWAASFPDSSLIISLIQFVDRGSQELEGTHDVKCAKHSSRRHNRYCDACRLPLCSECLSEDNHNNCSRVDTMAKRDLTDICVTSLDDIQTHVTTLQAKVESFKQQLLVNEREQISKRDTTASHISSFFADLRRNVSRHLFEAEQTLREDLYRIVSQQSDKALTFRNHCDSIATICTKQEQVIQLFGTVRPDCVAMLQVIGTISSQTDACTRVLDQGIDYIAQPKLYKFVADRTVQQMMTTDKPAFLETGESEIMHKSTSSRNGDDIDRTVEIESVCESANQDGKPDETSSSHAETVYIDSGNTDAVSQNTTTFEMNSEDTHAVHVKDELHACKSVELLSAEPHTIYNNLTSEQTILHSEANTAKIDSTNPPAGYNHVVGQLNARTIEVVTLFAASFESYSNSHHDSDQPENTHSTQNVENRTHIIDSSDVVQTADGGITDGQETSTVITDMYIGQHTLADNTNIHDLINVQLEEESATLQSHEESRELEDSDEFEYDYEDEPPPPYPGSPALELSFPDFSHADSNRPPTPIHADPPPAYPDEEHSRDQGGTWLQCQCVEKLYTIRPIPDTRPISVMAVCWASEGRLLVVDRWNCSIKLFHESGTALGSLSLTSPTNLFNSGAWDITHVEEEWYAVAIPQPRSIVQVNVFADGRMIIADRKSTGAGYAAIAYYSLDNVFICGSVPPFDKPRVDMVSMSGLLLRRFEPGSYDNPYFGFPKSIAVSRDGIIMVGDSKDNTITFLTSVGDVIGIYPDNPDHPPEKHIHDLQGFALASNHCGGGGGGATLFVTDGRANTIKLISATDRGCMDTWSDMMLGPKVMALNSECNRLIVGADTGRLNIFRLSWKRREPVQTKL
jgi:hypothetical protein